MLPPLWFALYKQPEHLDEVPSFIGIPSSKGNWSKISSKMNTGDLIAVLRTDIKYPAYVLAVRRVCGVPVLARSLDQAKWNTEHRQGTLLFDIHVPVTTDEAPMLARDHLFPLDVFYSGLRNRKGYPIDDFQSFFQFAWGNVLDAREHGRAYLHLTNILFGEDFVRGAAN